MSNALLQTVGESFANISGSIAECVRADAQNTPSKAHVEHFEQCLVSECQRLRMAGEDGLASVLEGIRGPLSRLMKEGW